VLARTQGYGKEQRRRVLNDALLFETARKHGCAVLTRNMVDFDLLQQLDPSGARHVLRNRPTVSPPWYQSESRSANKLLNAFYELPLDSKQLSMFSDWSKGNRA
jgi:hypothetical protein